MKPKNLLIVAVLILAGISLTPTTTASNPPSLPSCSIQSCVPVCTMLAAAYSCPQPCYYMAQSAPAYACPPPCSQLMGTSGSVVCPQPCLNLESVSVAAAVACPIPCVNPTYTSSTIACPRPPCDIWNNLSPAPCPVCPWPPSSGMSCPSLCPDGIKQTCGVCDWFATDPCALGPDCDLHQRECYPGPLDWTCQSGPDHGDGLVADTVDYASEMAIIALCVIVLPESNVILEQTGDTAYYAATQVFASADYAGDHLRVRGCCITVDDHGLVTAAAGTASNQVALTCSYLLGPAPCAGGSGPAPAPCPVTFVPLGGVVGETLGFAEASCANGMGGAAAATASANAIVDDAEAVAGAVAADVGGFVAARSGDAHGFLLETRGNLQDAVNYAQAGANYAKAATCTYLLGNADCSL